MSPKARLHSIISNTAQEIFKGLPISKSQSQGKLQFDLSALSLLRWKEKKNGLDFAHDFFKSKKNLKLKNKKLRIKPGSAKEASKSLESLREFASLLACENLQNKALWAEITDIYATGFDDKKNSSSSAMLSKLYQNDFIVAEKKPFVVDLNASSGPYLVSEGPNRESFMDAASQIATLALGYNQSRKKAMLLRPELKDPDLDVQKHDIYSAFCHLLRSKTGLPYVYPVNSGAEAGELALRGCQEQYPGRQRIFAFEHSFHGRTLLALHATYSPAKRTPFEIFPGMVDFFPFPEDKTPHQPKDEPKMWLAFWNEDQEKIYQDSKAKLLENADELLCEEVRCLDLIRQKLKTQAPLCFLAESMLCEGGDKYGSPRFFRALRVLTRKYDTALVMDEVQTGIGLGGSFFWYDDFKFQRVDGKLDLPDAVCVAKKAQAAACITRFKMDVDVEASAASMYRGYIQAQEVAFTDTRALNKRAMELLKKLREHLAAGVLEYPRGQGVAFAFDVKSPEIAMALVKVRFKHGLLFYPAGSHTLRFRLLIHHSEEELVELFTGIRKCFIELEEEKLIPAGRSLSSWIDEMGDLGERIKRGGHHEEKLPWGNLKMPLNKSKIEKLSPKDWRRVFRSLFDHFPQLLHSPWNSKFDVKKLRKLSVDDFWAFYLKKDSFTQLDLLWQASRAFGHKVIELSQAEVLKTAQQIDDLEASVYEPVRRESAENFAKYAKDSNSIFHAVEGEDGNLGALCVSAPLKIFSETGLVDADENRGDKKFLYGVDLTVNPKMQGQGLGLRLKCEQYIAAKNQNSRCIRSRNRYPESIPMIRLNQAMGSLIIDELPDAYGPMSLAKYQSLALPHDKERFLLRDNRSGALLNKGSLGNFVSTAYIANMEILKDLLPRKMQHVYLASGRAEAVDKAIKLLIHKRPGAWMALSMEGDFHGQSTACSRSLGDQSGPCFFDWPTIAKNAKESEIRNFIECFGADQILGFFLEPFCEKGTKKKKSESEIKKLCKIFKSYGIPVIFHETRSAFFEYDKKHFLAADKGGLMADISFFHAAPHLSVVATTKEYFYEKPLMMISTWDGDEWGLHMLSKKILKSLEKAK